jgi:hypothetical protein
LISLSLSQILNVAGTRRDIDHLNKSASQKVPFPLEEIQNNKPSEWPNRTLKTSFMIIGFHNHEWLLTLQKASFIGEINSF